MDFDLFDLDEDNDILSSLNLETIETNNVPRSECIPELECSGEDSLKSEFSYKGFVRNGFISKDFTEVKNAIFDITLTKFNLNYSNLADGSTTKYIFGEALMNIQCLLASLNNPSGGSGGTLSYYERRQEVTNLLYLVLYTIDAEQWPILRRELATIRDFLNHSLEPEGDRLKILYFVNNCNGNECNSPAYHMLHGMLEWRLLDLCILYKFIMLCADEADKHEFFLQTMRVVNDLFICSAYYFTKRNSVELLFDTPFPCTCFKEIWLILQQALEIWSPLLQEKADTTSSFWSLVSKGLGNMSVCFDSFFETETIYCEYASWMIYSLTRLHGYRYDGYFDGPNYIRAPREYDQIYEHYYTITESFLYTKPNEEKLRIYICLLMATLLEWWNPRVDIPMQLWEHFHKRLNSTFYIPGAPPNKLAVTCATGKQYLEKYQTLMANSRPDANLNSFTLFAIFVGKMQERLLQKHLRNQAQKLLGRIYSKFSLQKFLSLSEMGIHNLIELFLILALGGNFHELGPQLRDKLLIIAFDKVVGSKQIAIAKGHMALLLLFAEHRCDLSEYVTKIMEQLKSIGSDVAVSKVIADSLLDIFILSDDFQRGEHLLIGPWLPNFLGNCTPSEQDRTLEAIHLIFIKMQQNELFLESNTDLLKALTTHILPFIKEQYATEYSSWLPRLAADFCTISHGTDTQAFHMLFNFFIEVSTANRQALPQFLLRVLESDKGKLIESNKILQVWLKSLVLLTANNEDIGKLTTIAIEMEDFQTMTNLNPSEILIAKEPLCVFVSAVGKTYDSTTDYQKRCKIADNFNAYISNFEKWLQIDVNVEKMEILTRFYSFIAIVIYNCPQIVYIKSKITCFFHVAMTRFILPTSIQMGKAPDPKIAQLVHKIWPVLAQGIGRLNFKTDTYITKTLNDLIQKWTPHFKISSNTKIIARPFIHCLQSDNYDLSLFIFEKLTSVFLVTQRRQAGGNACLVITIFQEVVNAFSTAATNENKLRLLTFMKGTCFLTLEHIMMVDAVVPSRDLIIELFRSLIKSEVYREYYELKDLLMEHLKIITKKHLAYFTFFYFELLNILAKISFDLIEGILDFVKAEVLIVEQKRDAGQNSRLRECLQKLHQIIENSKK